jgi:hypothetical protein
MPFLMFAFLTRYNNALLIIPIFFYVLINWNKINFKNLILGIIGSLIILVPVFIFFYEKFGNIIYPFINFGSSSTAVSTATESLAYNPNILYYIQLFPALVGIQGFIIVLVVALGTLFYLYLKLFKNQDNKHLLERLRMERLTKIKLAVLVVLTIIFLGSFGKTVYISSEILFFIMAYMMYDLSKNSIKDIDDHLMIFVWFMAFLIFNSIFVVKDNRYFLLMVPPVAYFMILGLSKVFNAIKFKIRNKNILFPSFAIILIIILLFSTATQISVVLQANNNEAVTNEQVQMASQWFINYDPNYKNQNVYSDLWPNFSWYLKTNIKPVPIFKNNQTFADVGGLKNSTFNQADSNQFNNYLIDNNVEYYFSVRPGLNLTSYKPIKEFNNTLGNVVIYKRI